MTERPNPVYVKLIRPEGYEDVPPGALVHDAVHDEFEPEIVDFPTREEGDADVPAAGREPHEPTGPDVAPPAVGPHNLTAGVPDAAVNAAFNATGLYGYPLGCGATAIRCVMDMLTAALPHLEWAVTCGTCGGAPHPSGLPCICGGKNTQAAETQGLREALYDLEVALGIYTQIPPRTSPRYADVQTALARFRTVGPDNPAATAGQCDAECHIIGGAR